MRQYVGRSTRFGIDFDHAQLFFNHLVFDTVMLGLLGAINFDYERLNAVVAGWGLSFSQGVSVVRKICELHVALCIGEAGANNLVGGLAGDSELGVLEHDRLRAFALS